MRRKHHSEREQLELFRALPGDLAPRDAQDLMAYPFFSLAKTKRIVPIDFRTGAISIRVEAVPEHGMATIWDADVLIWAASQIIEARDASLQTSRLMAATPYEILTLVGRGTSARDYDRLKGGLGRLQSTTVLTSIRQPAERRRHRFSWINEWKERADANGRPFGIELILPDWFYAGVIDEALVLTIDRAYFDLTGELERWLYRLVRKHGGHQDGGWSFDLVQLHAKSGILSQLKHFAYDVRQIVQRQTQPGYQLVLTRDPDGTERLNFAPKPVDPLTARTAPARSHSKFGGQPVNQLMLSGTATLVLSGTRSSCYQGPESSLRGCFFALSGRSNSTNQKSFGFLLTHQAENLVRGDWQPQAASPVWLCKSHTLFAEPNAHGCQLQRQGAAA
ncbi:plasmid replication initiation protein [Bradyrhizobium sp. USDA 336]